jgi:leader peptidase (prepilin peptidase) / N-methyltransferase
VNAVTVPALAVVAAVAGVLGVGVGTAVNRAAARFPWPPARAAAPVTPGVSLPELDDHGAGRPCAVRPPVVELGTGVLFALTAWRFGVVWELPAFLVLAAASVLLAIVDVQHRLLPNRVLVPAFVAGAILLTGAAALSGDWAALLRAGVAALVLFAVYLLLALIAPSGLGMGDVKLAGLLGLYLGWLGWGEVIVGAAAGFVVQAFAGLVLLAGRRIGLRSELPFGPAMLLGAAFAIAAGDLYLR